MKQLRRGLRDTITEYVTAMSRVQLFVMPISRVGRLLPSYLRACRCHRFDDRRRGSTCAARS